MIQKIKQDQQQEHMEKQYQTSLVDSPKLFSTRQRKSMTHRKNVNLIHEMKSIQKKNKKEFLMRLNQRKIVGEQQNDFAINFQPSLNSPHNDSFVSLSMNEFEAQGQMALDLKQFYQNKRLDLLGKNLATITKKTPEELVQILTPKEEKPETITEGSLQIELTPVDDQRQNKTDMTSEQMMDILIQNTPKVGTQNQDISGQQLELPLEEDDIESKLTQNQQQEQTEEVGFDFVENPEDSGDDEVQILKNNNDDLEEIFDFNRDDILYKKSLGQKEARVDIRIEDQQYQIEIEDDDEESPPQQSSQEFLIQQESVQILHQPRKLVNQIGLVIETQNVEESSVLDNTESGRQQDHLLKFITNINNCNGKVHKEKSRVAKSWNTDGEDCCPINLMKVRLLKEQDISITQLKNHIRQNHPKEDNENWWPIWASAGSIFNFDQKREFPDFLRDLGLGPSLYLLTLKALGKIFMLLTILNLPAMYIYYSGTESSNMKLKGFQLLFAQFSMGNLGERGLGFSQMQLQEPDHHFVMKCNSGVLKNIMSIGLLKDQDHESFSNDKHARHIQGYDVVINKTDPSKHIDLTHGMLELIEAHDELEVQHNFVDYEQPCSSILSEDFRESALSKQLQSEFSEECTNEVSCHVHFDINLVNKKCQNSLDTIEKYRQVMVVVYFCETTDIKLAGTDILVSKSKIAIAIVIIDILSMAIILVFVNLLILMQEDFSHWFDVSTVEMRDFSVNTYGLPKSFSHYDDEVSIKFAIWEQIQQKLTDAVEAGIAPKCTDRNITEINFGIKSYSILNNLKQLEKVTSKVEILNIKYFQAESKTDKEKLTKQIDKQVKNLKKMYDQHIENFGEDSIYETIQKAKRQQENQGKNLFQEIRMVYITFLSMETKELVEKQLLRSDGRIPQELRILYAQREKEEQEKKIPDATHMLGMLTQKKHKNAPIQIQSQDLHPKPKLVKQKTAQDIRKALTLKLTHEVDKGIKRVNETLQVHPHVDPEYILWENIAYSDKDRRIRRGLSIFLAFLVIGATSILVRYFSEINDQIKEESVIHCVKHEKQLQSVSKIFGNVLKGEILHCYCLTNLDQVLQSDYRNSCFRWLKTYYQNQMVVYAQSLVVVTINVIAQELFIITAKFEHQYSTAIENQSIFTLIFVQQFINIGIILIITDQKFRVEGEFDAQWYVTLGTQLCLTMVIQTFSTKGGDLFRIFLNYFKRFHDRSFQFSWTTDELDRPRTRQYRQNDLNEVYTGTQIRIGYNLAQTFTILFVCLTYSSGLPIMYPIGTLYFLVTYWFDKICLMRFYQKTKVFNEELPQQSVKLFKYAVTLHFSFSALMYLSSSILLDNVTPDKMKNFANIDMNHKLHDKIAQPHILVLAVFTLITICVYIYNLKAKSMANTVFMKVLNIFKNVRRWFDKVMIINKNIFKKLQNPNPEQAKDKDKPCCCNDQEQGSSEHLFCNKSSRQFSHNLYGEILLDYLNILYQNHITYIRQCQKKLQQLKNKPDQDMIDVNSFKKYIESLDKNIKLIEDQIDFYYQKIWREIEQQQTALNKLKLEENFGDLTPIQVQGSSLKNDHLQLSQQTSKMLSMAHNLLQLESPMRSENLVINFEENSSKDALREEKRTNSDHSDSISKSYEFSDNEDQVDSQERPNQKSKNNEDHHCCEQEHIVFKDREKFYLQRLDYLDDHFDEDALNATLFPTNFRCASFSQSYNFMDNHAFNQANLVLDRAKTLIKKPLVFEDLEGDESHEE